MIALTAVLTYILATVKYFPNKHQVTWNKLARIRSLMKCISYCIFILLLRYNDNTITIRLILIFRVFQFKSPWNVCYPLNLSYTQTLLNRYFKRPWIIIRNQRRIYILMVQSLLLLLWLRKKNIWRKTQRCNR